MRLFNLKIVYTVSKRAFCALIFTEFYHFYQYFICWNVKPYFEHVRLNVLLQVIFFLRKIYNFIFLKIFFFKKQKKIRNFLKNHEIVILLKLRNFKVIYLKLL